MDNKFNLLKTKEIIEILDGDVSFNCDGIDYKMPYLSGPTICSISKSFGLPQQYSWEKGFANLSRWQYMDNLIEFCIKNKSISSFLLYLIEKDKFKNILKENNPDEIERKYKSIITGLLNKINCILYFGGNQLILLGNNFSIIPIGTETIIETPTIKLIDRECINDLAERALNDINENNYDSAITKARTVLEETFCYIIENNKEVPVSSGDISKLYTQVKNILDMHPDKTMDKRINMLLSGLEKIITSITEMRNANSDSHGVGKKRISIYDYHARLFVNASVMMADFILSVNNNKK